MSTSVLTGTGLEDLQNLATSVSEGKWVVSGLNGALVGAEGAALATNPFGTLVTWGVGWIIEHIQPLAGWYDDLAGEPAQIRARAKDMYASAAAITALADDTAEATRHSLGALSGRAVVEGRARGHEIANTLVTLGGTAHALGQGLEKAAALVEGVRSLIRDSIAEIVAWVGKKLILGVGTITFLPDLADFVGRKVPRARRLFELLTTSMSKLSSLIEKVRNVLEPIAEVARRVASRVPTLPPAARELLKQPGWKTIPTEMVIGMTASANDDAHDRPPRPRATRVPHSVVQSPGVDR